MVHFHLRVIREYWQWSLSFTIFSFEVMQEKYKKVKYDFYLKSKNFGDKSKHISVDLDVSGTQNSIKIEIQGRVYLFFIKEASVSCVQTILSELVTWESGVMLLNPSFTEKTGISHLPIYPPANQPFPILFVLRSVTAHLPLSSKGHCWASLVAPGHNAGDPGWSLAREDLLKKGTATHSIQYSRLESSMDRHTWQATQPVGCHRVGYDWVTNHPRLIDSGWTVSLISTFSTGRPGILWFIGSQRVRHDWATGLNWTELNPTTLSPSEPEFPLKL